MCAFDEHRDPHEQLCVCGHVRSEHTLFEHSDPATGRVFTTEFCRHYDPDALADAGDHPDDPLAGVCPCMTFQRQRRRRFRAVRADAA